MRAVVLDAAFGVEGFDPWIRQESIGLRFAWAEVCRRTAGCNANALATLRRWALRLERRPLVATGRDADGGRHRIRLDGAALGQIAGDGSFYYTIYRDLLAALRAYGRGDREPLLRLAAEDLPYTGGGPVRSYSEGAYAAVACHDYPTLWDPAASIPERRAQYRAARAMLEPDAYAPFRNDIWLRSLYINQYVTGCIEWPAPRYPDPPVPPGAAYPTMPVLVLDGDLDVITPLGDSVAGRIALPRLDLRDRAQRGARDRPRRLPGLRGGHGAPLPEDAVPRRRELRGAHARDPRGARVPAPHRRRPRRVEPGPGRPLVAARPPRRLGSGLGRGRRAGGWWLAGSRPGRCRRPQRALRVGARPALPRRT